MLNNYLKHMSSEVDLLKKQITELQAQLEGKIAKNANISNSKKKEGNHSGTNKPQKKGQYGT